MKKFCILLLLPVTVSFAQQGGETCAEATVISSLPYCASGTTTGYANDYNAPGVCGNSFGPDVVYRYTATVTAPAFLSPATTTPAICKVV